MLAIPEKNKRLIDELVEQGKAKGKVTTKEINDVMEELEMDVEQVDRLYDTLESLNVEVIDNMAQIIDSDIVSIPASEDLEVALSAEGTAGYSDPWDLCTEMA